MIVSVFLWSLWLQLELCFCQSFRRKRFHSSSVVYTKRHFLRRRERASTRVAKLDPERDRERRARSRSRSVQFTRLARSRSVSGSHARVETQKLKGAVVCFFPLLLLTAFILERRIFPRVQIKSTIKPQLFCVKSRKRACAWTGKGTRRMVRETRHLWVGNLPEHVREEKIVEYFKRWVGLLFVLKSLLLTLTRGLRFARVTGKKQQQAATSSEFPPHTTSKSTRFHLVGPLKEETTRCGATISIN